MYLRAVGRQFTQMNACFLVMNSKRCSYLNTDLSWLPPLYFSFHRFVVTFSSVVAVSRTRSRILNIRPCHVLILYRIFSKGWGEGCWIMWRIWVWLHWWIIRSAGERDVKGCKILYNCERFEPRSHFKSRLSLMVRVNVVLNRTVVVDSDGRSNSTLRTESPSIFLDKLGKIEATLPAGIKLNLLLKILYVMKYFFPIIWIKTEPIKKLSNFDFQRTKTLYQKNLNNIAS